MASRRDEDSKGFLSRWSQRKRAADEEKAGTPPREDAAAARNEADAPIDRPIDGPIDPGDLPDIDSLDAKSDYSIFMKEGVPPALRRRALNKLWQTDPAFREICMLDDYNLDYTDAATVVPNLKTLFQVGRGMVLPEEEEAERARAAETSTEGSAQEESSDSAEAAASQAPAEPQPDLAAQESRRKPRLPGTPLVTAAATPRSSASADARQKTARSARQRRWGEPES